MLRSSSERSAGWKASWCRAKDFRLELIEIGGLKRVGLRQTAATLVQLPVEHDRRPGGCSSSRRVAAVFSMGGYVAGPPVIAALVRQTPGGRHGAERHAGFHQSPHRAVCAPGA